MTNTPPKIIKKGEKPIQYLRTREKSHITQGESWLLHRAKLCVKKKAMLDFYSQEFISEFVCFGYAFTLKYLQGVYPSGGKSPLIVSIYGS